MPRTCDGKMLRGYITYLASSRSHQVQDWIHNLRCCMPIFSTFAGSHNITDHGEATQYSSGPQTSRTTIQMGCLKCKLSYIWQVVRTRQPWQAQLQQTNMRWIVIERRPVGEVTRTPAQLTSVPLQRYNDLRPAYAICQLQFM